MVARRVSLLAYSLDHRRSGNDLHPAVCGRSSLDPHRLKDHFRSILSLQIFHPFANRWSEQSIHLPTVIYSFAMMYCKQLVSSVKVSLLLYRGWISVRHSFLLRSAITEWSQMEINVKVSKTVLRNAVEGHQLNANHYTLSAIEMYDLFVYKRKNSISKCLLCWTFDTLLLHHVNSS